MQPGQTGIFEGFGYLERPGVVFFLLAVVALGQPNGFTIDQVDSGNDMHGGSGEKKR